MTRSPLIPSLMSPRPDDHSSIGILDKAIPTPAYYKRGDEGLLKYVITIDLNGYPSNQISVHNQNQIVTIKANRKETINSKESSIALTREFHFPTNVLPNTMQWKVDSNGILTIEANAIETDFLPVAPTFFSPSVQRRINTKFIESPIRNNFVLGSETRSSHTLIHSPSILTKLKSPLKSPSLGNSFGLNSPNLKKSQVKFADTVQNVTPNSNNNEQNIRPSLNGFVVATPVAPSQNAKYQVNDNNNNNNNNLKNKPTNHSPIIILSPKICQNKPNHIEILKSPLNRSSGYFNETIPNSPKFYVQKIKLNANLGPKDITVTRQNSRIIIAAKHSESIQDSTKFKSPVLSYQHYSEHTIPQGVDLNQLKVRFENGMITLQAPYVFSNAGLTSPTGQHLLDVSNEGFQTNPIRIKTNPKLNHSQLGNG